MAIALRDLTFPIKEAELCAAISDPYWCDTYKNGTDKELFWALDLHAADCDAYELYAPYVYHQSLHFPIRHWMDLANRSVTWDAPYDDVSGEPNGGFYVAEHESINKGNLRILDREGADFCIEWDGVCNVYWDETYGENVPFSIRAVARFTSVIVRGNELYTSDTLRDRLALYLDPDDFVQQGLQKDGHKYDSGVGIADCRFTPKLLNRQITISERAVRNTSEH